MPEEVKVDIETKLRLEEYRERARRKIGEVFDDKENFENNISRLLEQIEQFRDFGLPFDTEMMLEKALAGRAISGRDEFVAHFLKALEPFIVLRAREPKVFENIFERIHREETINRRGNIKLSEVLYADFNRENEAGIHMPPVLKLIKSKGIQYFESEVFKGLAKLAEIIADKPNIKEVWAVSPMITKNPKRFQELGFKTAGILTAEEQARDFPDDPTPATKAFMTREEFLNKYGKKTHE